MFIYLELLSQKKEYVFFMNSMEFHRGLHKIIFYNCNVILL